MSRRSFLVSSALFAVAAATRVQADTASAAFKVDGHVVLNAYQALVEEHLANALTAIRALAATSDAQTASWTSIGPALNRLSQDWKTDAAIWFALPDGSYFSTAGGKSSSTLLDRDYFPNLMSGHDVLGSLVISKSTGQPSIIVATPVIKEGHVVAAIGISVSSSLISKLVAERVEFPDNMIFYALNSKGQTSIHADASKIFQFPATLGETSLQSAVATILSQPQGTIEYSFGGKQRTAIFNKSEAIPGWHFVLVQIAKS
jgi:methyl-accepting chemotaxis protein